VGGRDKYNTGRELGVYDGRYNMTSGRGNTELTETRVADVGTGNAATDAFCVL
jgi:hypothetical protein